MPTARILLFGNACRDDLFMACRVPNKNIPKGREVTGMTLLSHLFDLGMRCSRRVLRILDVESLEVLVHALLIA